MSAELTGYKQGVLSARISGKLTHAELASLQRAASDIIRREGKVRILITVEDFLGSQRGGGWGDISFQSEHDACIEKMAIVGDRKWEDLALLFASKGIRRFPIEYFGSDEMSKAGAWLAQEQKQTPGGRTTYEQAT